MSESIPDRAERIMRDHNISLREAMRVARTEARIEKNRELIARLEVATDDA